MIPTEVVLSPQSYARVAADLARRIGCTSVSHLQLSHHLALAVSVQHKETDLVVLKELTPNPCPICHHRLTFLRETMERFENDSSNLIRCPMGHRYPGTLKVYYLNILKPEERNGTEAAIKTCPDCNGRLQYLAPKVMFCLECDWDSGMEVRY